LLRHMCAESEGPPTDLAAPELATQGVAAAGATAAPAEPAYTYQQKYTRCHKAACRRCANGPGHGPYWYAFWSEKGRTRARYLGKVAPAPAETPTAAANGHTPDPRHEPGIRVKTLGHFAVWRGDVQLRETAWQRHRSLALFKLLISAPSHRLLREQALDRLWPDGAPQSADAALRAATHGIRRALDCDCVGGRSAIEAHAGVIALSDGIGLSVDADEFGAAAQKALAGRDLKACREALALYGGDYLLDQLYDDWASARREVLAALRVSVLLHEARISAEQGDVAEARAALATVLSADPAHEEAACRLMTLLTAVGEHTEALRVYIRLTDALRDTYALEPSVEVANLARRIQAQQAARSSHRHLPPRPRRTNLPAELSSFVGRVEAQVTIRQLLSEARVVTLTGAGGAGKTRLATRVADSLVDDYPDGVWFCALASLPRVTAGSDAGLRLAEVCRVVAGAFGLSSDGSHRDLEATICAFLEPRELLLVLDNCEHLLDAVARLVHVILGRCPGVTVLATSQVALGLSGEQLWVVPPLSIPGERHTCALEQLGEFDAIRLFVERARVARPGFTLDCNSAPLVLEICRRLDCLPLALELAAGRLTFLGLDTLATRLDDRFRLLAGGSRTALPRHQSLRATMDWSYGLLGPVEQALLQRLAVLAEGFTLAEVERTCAGPDLEHDSLLDALGSLVARSLVSVHQRGESVRYGMLETVRHYSRAKLEEWLARERLQT